MKGESRLQEEHEGTSGQSTDMQISIQSEYDKLNFVPFSLKAITHQGQGGDTQTIMWSAFVVLCCDISFGLVVVLSWDAFQST